MRYLGSRLKPFQRPMFWGSLGLVCLIGFALYQYWQHPDWLDGNLSEIETTRYNSASNLSNTNQDKISVEDLAIGADLDNLDLLLRELEQNQTVPLSKAINPKKLRNSLQIDNKNTVYHRFQEEQKSKLNRSPEPLIPTKTTSNNLVQSPTRSMFKLPSFSGYNSTITSIPTPQNSTSSNPELIPNPIGRLYLSERNQFNNTIRANTTSGSVNSFSPINFISSTETTNTNLSSQGNSNVAPSEIRVNPGETNNTITPSTIPYNNNLNTTSITPRPSYGQPIYQQPSNVGVNPSIVGNQTVNILPTRFQPDNLSNQEQTQRAYQLTPSNYQLQPQGYNPSNVNNGLNSQSNTFSSNGSFENSQFNNN